MKLIKHIHNYARNQSSESKVQVFRLPSLITPTQKPSIQKNATDQVNSTECESISNSTPLQREIAHLQLQHPEHLLLVQVGSFYEIYNSCQNFEHVTNLLNLRIAKKQAYQFAGFPKEKVNHYLEVLVKNGITVAIADQVGKDYKNKTKNFIRQVQRIITPGTLFDETNQWMESKDNNFILCLTTSVMKDLSKEMTLGLAYADVSTGEFMLMECPYSQLSSEIVRIAPSEILLSQNLLSFILSEKDSSSLGSLFQESQKTFKITCKPSDYFESKKHSMKWNGLISYSCTKLKRKNSKKQNDSSTQIAGNVLLEYICDNFPVLKPHFREPIDVQQTPYLLLDSVTLQALEITKTQREQSKKGSLLHLMDQTKTAAGARLLSRRIKAPCMDIHEINRRLDWVELFYKNSDLRLRIQKLLSECRDVEKAIQRLYLGTGGPVDFCNILSLLEIADEIVEIFHSLDCQGYSSEEDSSKEKDKNKCILEFARQFLPFKEILNTFGGFLEDKVLESNRIDSIGCIKSGICPEIDHARALRDLLLQEKQDLISNLISFLETDAFSLGMDMSFGPVLDFARIPKSDLLLKLKQHSEMEVLSRKSNGKRYIYTVIFFFF